ncbi:MAG TPA: hypothetical protein ENG18_00765 [Nitrososphaeria archaeon]|nr:hypothetical protein [Nitrososphaeria archaeon]
MSLKAAFYRNMRNSILKVCRGLGRWCRVSETIYLLWGGSDFHRLLDDVPEKYSDTFAELRPGRLMDYAKVRTDTFGFCRYYAKWLGSPLVGRLKAEIYEVLEER